MARRRKGGKCKKACMRGRKVMIKCAPVKGKRAHAACMRKAWKHV